MADSGNINQSAFDHVPANNSLKPTEEKEQQAVANHGRLQPALEQKEKKREKEDQADQSPQHTMGVFHQEDELKVFQGYMVIVLDVFRILLVTGKNRLPVFLVQGRNGTHDRLPINHGQTGIGEPGETAQHDHAKNQEGDRIQPSRNIGFAFIGYGIHISNSGSAL